MKINNLAVIQGEKTTIEGGVINYIPSLSEIKKGKDGDEKKEPIPAEIRSDVLFSQGKLSFKIKAKNKETGVLLTHDSKDDSVHLFSAGLSFSTKTFRIYSYPDNVVTKGSLKNFKDNEEIKISYEIYGSDSKLYVNDILYCELILNPITFPLTFRITSVDKVAVYDIEIESAKPKLFVVMQFTEEFNNLYKDVIIPISEGLGFEIVRADEFYSSTPILNDIIKSLIDASVIIADITPDNPNVFYEIGYAHAIKKPTILICDKTREKLPFDVSSFRTLFYENSISGKTKIETSLKKYLENILNNGM